MRHFGVLLLGFLAAACGSGASSPERAVADADTDASPGFDATVPTPLDSGAGETGSPAPESGVTAEDGGDDGGDGASSDAGDAGDAGTPDAGEDAAAADAGSLLPLCADAGSFADAGSLEDGGVATAFFVAPGGSDVNSGAIGAPFATIQHCANVAQPGATCWLRAGTYRETVVPPTSGTPAAPITFQSYPCELAVVSGTEVVTGWTAPSSGHVYTAPFTTALTEDGDSTPRTQLFVDGQPATFARWPNVTTTAFLDPNDDATAASATTATSIADPSLSSFAAGTWNGATIHLRGGYAWTSLVGTVTTQTTSALSLNIVSVGSSLDAKPGSRYYLTNLLTALDAPGEWFSDGHTLSAWMPASDAPGAHVVEAKQRDLAFDLSNRAYVVIRGVELFGATIDSNASTSHVTIDSIVAAYPSYFVEEDGAYYSAHWTDSGIQLNGTAMVLENSEVFGSTNDGVVVGGAGNTVTNCLIHDVDSMAVYADPLFVTGSGHQITHDTIFNAGRDGIFFEYTDGTAHDHVVAFNDIHDYGALNQDLGGIYGWNLDWNGTVVYRNWVHDLVPTTDRGFTGAAVGSGLYFDNGSVNVVAHHNLTWNVSSSISLNAIIATDGGVNTEPSMFVYDNTFGPNAGSAALSVNGYPSPIDATGSRLINNIFAGGPVFPSWDTVSGETLANDILPGTNPMFVDPASDDFQLAPGSPAIGAGQVISGITSTTPPDIGAFEGGPFTVGCSLPGCH